MHPFRATSYWVSKQHFSKCWDVFKSHLRISCTSFFVCVYFFFLGRKVQLGFFLYYFYHTQGKAGENVNDNCHRQVALLRVREQNNKNNKSNNSSNINNICINFEQRLVGKVFVESDLHAHGVVGAIFPHARRKFLASKLRLFQCLFLKFSLTLQ